MYQFAELIAVIASAIYGAMLARQHRMDFIGVYSVSFIGAFGGGTLRDLFLDRHPLFWIENSHYPVIVFGIAIVVSIFRRAPKWFDRILVVSDALGLGLFSIIGAMAALEAGTSWFVAALFGVVTGTFGGVIGDIVCNRVPSLFSTATLYATCSFIGCWVLFFLLWSNVPDQNSVVVSVLFIVIFRVTAIYCDWRLPEIRDDDEHETAD